MTRAAETRFERHLTCASILMVAWDLSARCILRAAP